MIMPTTKPIVWSVAGSDCSGLAGQVADIRAMEALGAHPCMITTAVTAQNNDHVLALNPLTAEQIQSQLEALRYDLAAKAIKVGILPNKDAVQVLLDFMADYSGHVILDPVMKSSSGTSLVGHDTVELYKKLLQYATVITPNLPELELLSGIRVDDETSIKKAAQKVLAMGVKAVLVKGGHLEQLKTADSNYVHDYFISANQEFWLHCRLQQTSNTRGTGCVLASAIAATLAQDYSLEDAVVVAKMLLNQGLRHGYSLPRRETEINNKKDVQKGPLAPLHWPDEAKDLPLLTDNMETPQNQAFLSCGDSPLGLYPVVDRAEWLERLLSLGVSTIQLRVKDLTGQELEQEIIKAIAIAERYQARLFINDYWQLAIKHCAYGVHLGQEDIETADIPAIKKAGLRLGLSTHCYYEVARANTIKPSYLACGPVYHTDSKDMPWIPHGLDNLLQWKKLLPEYPWVAIGGINLARFSAVAATGVSGVAMISAITQAEDAESVVATMLEQFKASEAIDVE